MTRFHLLICRFPACAEIIWPMCMCICPCVHTRVSTHAVLLLLHRCGHVGARRWNKVSSSLSFHLVFWGQTCKSIVRSVGQYRQQLTRLLWRYSISHAHLSFPPAVICAWVPNRSSPFPGKSSFTEPSLHPLFVHFDSAFWRDLVFVMFLIY